MRQLRPTKLLTATICLASAGVLGAAHAAGPYPSASEADGLRATCEAGLASAGSATLAPAAAEACHKAYLLTHKPRDTRNKVAAMMVEKAKPDLDTVALASLIADSAVSSAPEQPWGYLARHDIARTLGRADLLAASRSALEPHAAREPLVRAALDARVGGPAPWVWLVRIAVLLGLAGTALHAFRNRRRGAAPAQTPATAAVPSKPAAALALLLGVLPSSRVLAAPADMPQMKDGQISSFKIDDAHPEEAVKTLAAKTKDPLQLGYLLQDLAAQADKAHKAGDHARAARYYHALAVAAPTPFGPRMECQALETIGDIAGAIPACRELLTRQGAVVNDYVHFVELVLKSPKPLPDLEPKELEGVIAHLEKEAQTGTLPAVLRCKVAMRFEEPALLEKCEAAMSTAPAGDPTVISLKWGLAMRRHDTDSALRLIEEAQRAGVSADNVEKMRQTTNAISRGRFRKVGVIGGLSLFLAMGAFLGVRLLGSTRRRATTTGSAV